MRFEHGGNVYEPTETDGQWIDFSANINPLGLPHTALAAIEAKIPDLIHYPDPAARELKAALSEAYGTPVDTLVLGNGAAELFYLFFETVRPRRVLLPVPSFSEYERAALAAGAEIEYFPLREKNGFAVDAEALLAEAERTQADAVVLGNPNNPTGTLLPSSTLVHISERLIALGCALVVDEAFLDFRIDEERFTLRKEAGKLPHCFVVRSMTKFYALPGLRLGFGIATPALIRKLETHKDVWNVNLLAQAAGVAVLSDRQYQETSRNFLQAAAPAFCTALAKLPGVARVSPPCVNFLLVHLKDPADKPRIIEGLRKRNILVRDCANFTGLSEGYLRLAVRRLEDNEKLLQAWREIYSGF